MVLHCKKDWETGNEENFYSYLVVGNYTECSMLYGTLDTGKKFGRKSVARKAFGGC